MAEIIYLDASRADVADLMRRLNAAHVKGNLSAMMLTHWDKDGHMHFSLVGDMTVEGGQILTVVGSMEHHKYFLMNAYNAALIATAQQLTSEADATGRDPEEPAG